MPCLFTVLVSRPLWPVHDFKSLLDVMRRHDTLATSDGQVVMSNLISFMPDEGGSRSSHALVVSLPGAHRAYDE